MRRSTAARLSHEDTKTRRVFLEVQSSEDTEIGPAVDDDASSGVHTPRLSGWEGDSSLLTPSSSPHCDPPSCYHPAVLDRLKPRWVDTVSAVADVANACVLEGRFALDTEADSLHSYFHKVCLIQVSAGDHHFLLDPLALSRDDLQPLWRVAGDRALTVWVLQATDQARGFYKHMGCTLDPGGTKVLDRQGTQLAVVRYRRAL